MRVSNFDSMYPVLRRISSEVNALKKNLEQEKPAPVSIDAIINNSDQNEEITLPRPGKGYYIIFNDPKSNSYLNKPKSNLSPMQQRMNKTYHLETKKATGILVDMTV